jgi:hypothetical protein
MKPVPVSASARWYGGWCSLLATIRSPLAVMGVLAAASARLPFYFASALMLLAGAILALNPAARKLSAQN